MVDRLQTEKIVIVDLDGTLISGNSFHEFIKVTFHHSSIIVKIKLFGIFMQRFLRIIDHAKMKFKILKNVSFDLPAQEEFKSKISKLYNEEIIHLLHKYKKTGATIWLATAAPSLYIPLIWDGDFVSTDCDLNSKEIECKGDSKVEELKKHIKDYAIIEAVITDHYDDIPLLKIGAKKNILVNPSAKTIKNIKKENIEFTIFDKDNKQ